MLILLPPSEGKTAPDSGPLLDLEALSFPELREPRRSVLAALTSLCRGSRKKASEALGLGPRQAADIDRNAALRREPCAPAISVYSGVLFEHLAYPTLTAAQIGRANESLAVASALWGLVRPTDLIPAYRLSATAHLPAIPSLRRTWHGPLHSVFDLHDGLVLDLRSGAYRDLAQAPPSPNWLSIRVFTVHNGRRTIVSHHNKATKGRIARAVLQSRRTPNSVDGLVSALNDWGYPADLSNPGTVDVTTV